MQQTKSVTASIRLLQPTAFNPTGRYHINFSRENPPRFPPPCDAASCQNSLITCQISRHILKFKKIRKLKHETNKIWIYGSNTEAWKCSVAGQILSRQSFFGFTCSVLLCLCFVFLWLIVMLCVLLCCRPRRSKDNQSSPVNWRPVGHVGTVRLSHKSDEVGRNEWSDEVRHAFPDAQAPSTTNTPRKQT